MAGCGDGGLSVEGAEMMERPAESAYYVAQELEYFLERPWMADTLIIRIRTAIDLLRWYDWEEEQRRRQSLKGS
jgi:hypothetical protein